MVATESTEKKWHEIQITYWRREMCANIKPYHFPYWHLLSYGSCRLSTVGSSIFIWIFNSPNIKYVNAQPPAHTTSSIASNGSKRAILYYLITTLNSCFHSCPNKIKQLRYINYEYEHTQTHTRHIQYNRCVMELRERERERECCIDTHQIVYWSLSLFNTTQCWLCHTATLRRKHGSLDLSALTMNDMTAKAV